MEGEFIMLRYSCRINDVCEFLMGNIWETRPDMSFQFIIHNIDSIFVLRDFNDTKKLIGFMVYTTKGVLEYFEILKEYRGKGYAKDILKHMNIRSVMVNGNNENSINFWKHMNLEKKIEYIC